MCGISGYFITPSASESLKSRLSDGSVLRKMNDVIAHRGPDGEGFFQNEYVGLGHRRLAIIDLSTGDQPIYNEDRTKCIVFNGEIYNYKPLRNDLLQKGHKFNTTSDTEVILHLFEERGEECVHDLNGIFAFAIYDFTKNRIFLARDHYGVKPLYIADIDGVVAFASELKSIVAFSERQLSLNIQALNYYLTFEHVPAPLTIYNEVHKLEQGESAFITSNGLTKWKYFTPTFSPKFTETREEWYIDQLDRLLDTAVNLQTMSDVPLGAFLSGGIDSSLITAYLSRHSNKKVQTFSIAFQEKSFDESDYARKVAHHLGTEHHEQLFTTHDMLSALPVIFSKLDEPFADASLLPTYLLSKFTREHVTVSLSGDGSDELFAGYPTYYARKKAGFMPSWAGAFLEPLVQLLPVNDDNISFDFKVKKLVAGLAAKDLDERHQYWLGSFDVRQKKELFSQDVQKKLHSDIEKLQILRDYMKYSDTEPNWERSLWCDMRFYLQDNMLVKVDRASMLNSLEARVPFLDRNLSDFAFRIPAHLKYHGKTSKYILKKLAYKYLPAEIIERPKKGFGIPVAKWIKTDLRELFADTLLSTQSTSSGLFERRTIQRLLDEHIQNKKDNRKLLWTLFVFEQWRSSSQFYQ